MLLEVKTLQAEKKNYFGKFRWKIIILMKYLFARAQIFEFKIKIRKNLSQITNYIKIN